MRTKMLWVGLSLIALSSLAWGGGAVAPMAPEAALAGSQAAAPDMAAAADDAGSVLVLDFTYQDGQTGTEVTHVLTGEAVTWIWIEGTHTVTHGVGDGLDVTPPAFDSGLKSASDREPFFTTSLALPGVYAYHCTLHVAMRGVVVVT